MTLYRIILNYPFQPKVGCTNFRKLPCLTAPGKLYPGYFKSCFCYVIVRDFSKYTAELESLHDLIARRFSRSSEGADHFYGMIFPIVTELCGNLLMH